MKNKEQRMYIREALRLVQCTKDDKNFTNGRLDTIIEMLITADEVVKKLTIPAVIGRSEQLKAFVRWVKANDRHIVDGDFSLIDDYLKSL